jgi:phasin family protein
MPFSPFEQIQAAQSAGFDISCGLAKEGLDGLQKLLELNLRTMKSTLADIQETTRTALAAKDVGELLVQQAGWLQSAAEKAQAYQRELAEISTAVQGDLAKVADAQFEEGKRQVQDAIDNAAKGTPAGSEAALAAWKSALSAGATLFETMQQTSRQAMEAVENNRKTITAAASKSAQQAAAQTARATKH